jgi:hypothetical protein
MIKKLLIVQGVPVSSVAAQNIRVEPGAVQAVIPSGQPPTDSGTGRDDYLVQ